MQIHKHIILIQFCPSSNFMSSATSSFFEGRGNLYLGKHEIVKPLAGAYARCIVCVQQADCIDRFQHHSHVVIPNGLGHH